MIRNGNLFARKHEMIVELAPRFRSKAAAARALGVDRQTITCVQRRWARPSFADWSARQAVRQRRENEWLRIESKALAALQALYARREMIDAQQARR